MADHDGFQEYLRSLDARRLQDVIASLEVYEDRFAPEHVVPGATVLLNILPELPERQRGMSDLDSRLVVTRVAYRLIRSLKDTTAAEEATRRILPELKSLSARHELITIVGHGEGRGHKLVSEAAAAEFERAWRDEVRATSTNKLVKEYNLLWLLLETQREAGPSEPTIVIDEAPPVTKSILRAARGEVRSQTLGSRAMTRSPRLAWDALIELYGDERTLRNRIESLKLTGVEDAKDLLELAEKYLGGWRPSD